MSGNDDYCVLQIAGSEIFHEINDLIKTGTTSIDGQDIALEFYLGGDYKVILMSTSSEFLAENLC